MTTTDTGALTERIARALYENAVYYGPEDVQPAWERRDDEERDEWREIAAAVLPIVAAEVRAAKAEALDEFTRFAERHKDDALTRSASDDEVYRWAIVFTTAWNYRATEHETGDSDEH